MASARSPKPANHPIYEAAKAKWKSSGLTDEHARALGLRPLTRQEVQDALGIEDERPCGMLLPYFDLDGKPTEFFRIRYLEKMPGFAGLIEKPQRYVQPAKTLNEVYLPPILATPWSAIAKDPDTAIYITEGEFKAAAACAAGLPTIGLGGVDMWRSSKRGLAILPQLETIEWKNRSVVIVYDSDAATNLNVVRAQRQLAHALIDLGALPSVGSLPPGKDGAKQGLDDYLLALGSEALLQLLRDAPLFPEADALWGMNEKVIYVRDPGFVIEVSTAQRMDPARFASHHYSNHHYIETVIKTDAKGNTRAVSSKKPLAKRWLEWERRNEVQRVTYAPGQPRMHEGALNVWPGWGVAPVRGDMTVWATLLDHIFQGHTDERRYFEQWCAYPIQHPGAKLFTYVLLWSVAQGTGKSYLGYLLKAIYGHNGIEIDSEGLAASFNAWAEHRQFVIGDEVSTSREDGDKIKSLVTRAEILVNQKYMPVYRIPDCINYLLTSNQPDAMFMEDKDRRGFVYALPDDLLPKEFWVKADKWLNATPTKHDGPGPAALMHHLLHVDLTGFNPAAAAPFTAAKEEMILDSKSPLGTWITHLKDDAATTLRPLGEKVAQECDLFTVRQLLRCFDPERAGRASEAGLSRELRRAGFVKINEGKTVRTKAGVCRLYAIRNLEKWAGAALGAVTDHRNKCFGEAKF